MRPSPTIPSCIRSFLSEAPARAFDPSCQPIGGAVVSLEVIDTPVTPVTTGVDGRFALTGIPAGPGHLHVDGLVATTLGGDPIPPGSFPRLSFSRVIVPEAENFFGLPVRRLAVGRTARAATPSPGCAP